MEQDSQLLSKNKNLLPRPPIVVILGHVDHGKTTLLDYIRKTNLAAKEAGEITQSIGAYEVVHHNKKITFIDTPGHEAFNKMRERGANVADVAVLVVAADESIKPQTKESIEILNKTKTPFIVAINKIDKPTANINKVINDLMDFNVLLEKYGGNIPWQAISAKTGDGVSELLDLIILMGEMENLTYDPKAAASGVIIESKLDSKRGITVSAILKNGILKNGDLIATDSASGKIKTLENFLGQRVESLSPSAPALILGFETMPEVGEEFFAGEIDLVEIQPVKIFERKVEQTENFVSPEDSRNYLNLILKADTSGSLEALKNVLSSLPLKDKKVKFLEEAVGDINDSDVKLAQATGAIIIGFKTKSQKTAQELAKIHSIKIINSEIIYEIGKILEESLAEEKSQKTIAELEVLAVFNQKTKKQIIGGKVTTGVFKNRSRIKIMRNSEEIGWGKVINLQSQKQDVEEVRSGNECGLLIESDTKISIGDHLIQEL